MYDGIFFTWTYANRQQRDYIIQAGAEFVIELCIECEYEKQNGHIRYIHAMCIL